MIYRVPFGDLKISQSSKRRLEKICDSDWVSEGQCVRQFEDRFAERFGWKHCIATSSGTDAGQVVWAAALELSGPRDAINDRSVITPACAFVSTASCLISAGLNPVFVDVDPTTLNMTFEEYSGAGLIGVQFVATMGKPSPLLEFAEIQDDGVWLIGDFCEAHGATLGGEFADHLCDAAIYSFYAAHLVIGGEGGCIVTNNDELADLCKSIKSHGRPESGYFSFDRIGFNSKWNEPCAAIALGSLEQFDDIFNKRREIRGKLLKGLEKFEEDLILFRDDPGEVISPHAFPILLRNRPCSELYELLEKSGVQCKSLFGSLPTQHKAFRYLGYEFGEFPGAEYIGISGLHFSCGEHVTDDDIKLIVNTVERFLKGK